MASRRLTVRSREPCLVCGKMIARGGRHRCRATLGDWHPATLTLMINMAVLLQRQGSYSEAAALLREAAATSEASLGRDHPIAVATAEIVASFQ